MCYRCCGPPLHADWGSHIPRFWAWGLLTVHSESLSVNCPWSKLPHSSYAPPRTGSLHPMTGCSVGVWRPSSFVLIWGQLQCPFQCQSFPFSPRGLDCKCVSGQPLAVPILLSSLSRKPPPGKSLSQGLCSRQLILRQCSSTNTSVHYKTCGSFWLKLCCFQLIDEKEKHGLVFQNYRPSLSSSEFKIESQTVICWIWSVSTTYPAWTSRSLIMTLYTE